MNTSALLDAEKNHHAGLLEAIQRCVYLLHASSQTLTWPLQGTHLLEHKKDNDLFESLAAINARFAKLQDTLGAAMRHSLVLSGDQADSLAQQIDGDYLLAQRKSFSSEQFVKPAFKKPRKSPFK